MSTTNIAVMPNKVLASYANYNCDTIINGKKLGGLNSQQEYRSQPQEIGSAVQISVVLQTDTKGKLFIDYTNIVHEPYEVIELFPIDFSGSAYPPLPLANGQNFYTQYTASTIKGPYFRVRFKNLDICKQKVFRITTFLFQTITEFKTEVTLPPTQPPTPTPNPQRPPTYSCITSQDTRCPFNQFRRMQTTYKSDGTSNEPTLVRDPSEECDYIPSGRQVETSCNVIHDRINIISTGSYSDSGQLITRTQTIANDPSCGAVPAGTDCGYICTLSNNTISFDNQYKNITKNAYVNQGQLDTAYSNDTSRGPYKKYLLSATGLYTTTGQPTVIINTHSSSSNDQNCGYQAPPPSYTFNFYVGVSDNTYYLYSQAVPVNRADSLDLTLNTLIKNGGKTSSGLTTLTLYGNNNSTPPPFNNPSWLLLKNNNNIQSVNLSNTDSTALAVTFNWSTSGIKCIRLIGLYVKTSGETDPTTVFNPASITIYSSNNTYISSLTPSTPFAINNNG